MAYVSERTGQDVDGLLDKIEDVPSPGSIARLDEAGELLPAQASPLLGRQRGYVSSSNPCRYETTLPQTYQGSFTTEFFAVTDGAIISWIQFNALNSMCWFEYSKGYPVMKFLYLKQDGSRGEIAYTGTTLTPAAHHFVFSFDAETKTARMQIDGVMQPDQTISDMNPLIDYFQTNRNYSSAKPYYHARLFNYALSEEEALALWNGGRPGEYMLPNAGAFREGCLAEYLPCGLLENRWRDTSGQGLDLTASGTPKLSYQPPQDLRETVIDTGVFYTDITEGVASKSVAVQGGYAITRISVWNGNAGALSAVSASLNGSVLFSDKSVTTASPLLVVPTDGLDYRKTANTLVLNATGNTSEGGMRIKVFCRWIGF